MQVNGIVKSLLDTDLYKINMLCVYFNRFPNKVGRFEFKCRNKDVRFTSAMLKRINDELDKLCQLRFTDDEIIWLSRLPWLKTKIGFLSFLRLFQFNRTMITAELVEGGKLKISAKGPIYMISYFETFVLSIVSEVYYDATYPNEDCALAISKLGHKIQKVKDTKLPFKFSEFGARRRFSFDWHDKVVKTLKDSLPNTIFTGTSDMYLAKKYNLVPQGTMAHEFLCLGQALDNVTLEASQRFMFQQWADEFRGNLGIALSDNLGIDKFLKDFDLYFAKLFNGIRQDSGDPIEVGNKVIEHYKSLGIDPKTKTIVFSDCLDFNKAISLCEMFADKIGIAFGIGTNLVCDMGSFNSLQCVMKLVEVDDKPVAKISDSDGKVMCEDDNYINYLKSVIKK